MSIGDSTSTSQDPTPPPGDQGDPGAAHGSTEGTGRNQDEAGLYGSRPGLNMVAAASSELVGTFLLVLAITATASAVATGGQVAGNALGSLSIPLVNGFALAALAVTFGATSGAHFNPAVTLALAVTRRFPWSSVLPYLVAQMLGAVLAALATWGAYGSKARSVAALGATKPGPGVSGLDVLLVEALVTFFLMIVVIAATTDTRNPAAAAPFGVGLALASAVFISAPLTGAGVNPARALGPMLVSGQLTDWWAYLLGPVLGALVAAVLHDRFLSRAQSPA